MRILYAGFKGKNNTSFQLVSALDGERLFLTNSFSGIERDIEAMNAEYDAVIMFGLDKTLSNAVRIENQAALHGDTLSTVLPTSQMVERLVKNGINCEISERPTHYLCNDAYYRMLRKTNGKAMFVHIPGSRYMTDELMAGIVKSLGEQTMSLFSKQIDKRIAAYQRELIETHYREVDNMYRQIRGWRHDYRNHIQTMKVLAANGDMDAIKSYLDELDTDLNTVDTVVKTGNAMADAILNSKISLAQSKCINVQCDAHIPVKLKMSELDLCCIIGNLFDNAIEASQKLPEDQRLIRVYMDMKGTQLYISFTNFTASKKMEKVGKVFKTSKGDGHGFGLVRIDAIIERLDGYLSRNSEDGAFTTEILIPQV